VNELEKLQTREWALYHEFGLVRIRIEPDESLYDDSYLETWGLSQAELKEQSRALWAQIERDGVWGIVGEFRRHAGAPWEVADSVWGFVGCDVFAPYDSDVKAMTLEALDRAFKAEADELASRATFAVVPA
jgi:hypothetical protein